MTPCSNNHHNTSRTNTPGVPKAVVGLSIHRGYFYGATDMLKQGLTHPKLYELCSRLECTRPTAIGYLELLWDFTADQCPTGNVGKWQDGAISRACEWPDDPERFVTALVEAGWLDPCDVNRLVVHDWLDHCPRWVKAKIARNAPTVVATTVASAVASQPDFTPDSKTNTKVKTNKERTRFLKPTLKDLEEYAPDIDASAFLDYYESNGWRVGRNPMKSWRHAVGNWRRRQKDFHGGNGQDLTEDEVLRQRDQRLAETRALLAESKAYKKRGEG